MGQGRAGKGRMASGGMRSKGVAAPMHAYVHNTLYMHASIRNLPTLTVPPTPEEFKRYFSQYGEVVEAQIMQDHMSGRSRGFG
jgi:hypothetical protein